MFHSPILPGYIFSIYDIKPFGKCVIVSIYHQILTIPTRRWRYKAIKSKEIDRCADFLSDTIVTLSVMGHIHAQCSEISLQQA